MVAGSSTDKSTNGVPILDSIRQAFQYDGSNALSSRVAICPLVKGIRDSIWREGTEFTKVIYNKWVADDIDTASNGLVIDKTL